MKEQLIVAGIGELLWDVFPNHRRLGGAPANFAYHAQQLGAKSYPVSSIGADRLGEEIHAQLKKLGVDTTYITEIAAYPTGTVDVVLKAGKPTYEIHENTAWDHIPFSNELRNLASNLDAVCFGTLSQRSAQSQKTIHSFIVNMRTDAVKIFDVNLRQSFFSKEQIAASLKLANVLKVSDEELPVLAKLFELKGNAVDQLQQLAEQFELRLTAYTRGPNGSLLVSSKECDDFAGYDGAAVDTVGAGDSFTATLCMGLLMNKPLSKVNQLANEVATYVCSQIGATPQFPAELTGKNAFS